MKISDTIEQIIFKNKSKLNIINNKILQFIEAPSYQNGIISDYNNNSNKIKIENNRCCCGNLNVSSEKEKFQLYSRNNIEKNLNEINKKLDNETNLNTKKNEDYIKNILNNFYEKIKIIFKQQTNINLLNKNLNGEYELNNCCIVNRDWFNKVLKIFQPENIFQKDKIIFEFKDDFQDMTKLDKNELNKIYDLFIKRNTVLKDLDLLKVNVEYKNESEYPINFVIIDENDLKSIINIKEINEYKYKIIIVENILFIIDKNNNNNFFAYSNKDKIFKLEAIFMFEKKENFKNEIALLKEQKGELSKYYKERHLDSNIKEIQKIMNNDDYKGNIIIVKSEISTNENNNK